MPDLKKWENEACITLNWGDLDRRLKEYGEKGYELVSVIESAGIKGENYILFFKKPKD